MEWWKSLLMGVAVTIVAAIAFILGRQWPMRPPQSEVIVKVDTLLIRDTITRTRPIFTDRRVVGTMQLPLTKMRAVPSVLTIRDSLAVHDTMYVLVEKEQLVWQDSLSRVYVSGILPQVDSVQHFVQKQIITVDHFREVTKKAHWGIGVQLGYGAGVNNGRIVGVPYVGLGVSYNIFSW